MKIFGQIFLAFFAFILVSCSEAEQVDSDPQYEFRYSVFHDPKLISFEVFLNEIAEVEADGMDNFVIESIYPILKIGKDKKVWAYDITYPSVGVNGEILRLSARVYIPVEVLSGSKAKGMVLANHHLITALRNSPTKVCIAEALPAWLGYIVVTPDLIGLGTSSESDQLISDSNFNAKGALEALKAAMMLTSDKGLSFNEERIYNYGYSLGGQMAFANLRYISLHPENEITFYKTFAGCGSYDPSLSMSGYVTPEYEDAAPLAVAGVVSLIAESNGKIKPEDVFLEPLLSTYEELYLSKKYNTDEIRERFGDLKLSEVLTSGVIAKTSDAGIALEKMALSQRVYGGWTLPEGHEFYLFGSKDDDYIPYSNFVAAEYFMESTFPEADMHFYSIYTGGHVLGVVPFALWIKENWD